MIWKRPKLSLKSSYKGKRKIAKMKTASGPLMLTEDKGGDKEEEEEEGEQESEKEVELAKKKGRVIITKPPKSSTAIFTRR